MDTTGPYELSAGGTQYDVHIVDEASRKGWVAHVRKRNEVPSVAVDHFVKLKGHGYPLKYLRLDNAGEHKGKLPKACDSMGITLEYTAPNTPQMNGVAESRIQDSTRAVATMLGGSQLNEKEKSALRAETASTYAVLRNLHVATLDGKSSHELFDGKPSQLAPQYWIEPGRIGYVTDRKKIKGKAQSRGSPCVFVGYAPNHPPRHAQNV